MPLLAATSLPDQLQIQFKLGGIVKLSHIPGTGARMLLQDDVADA